jgi:hypothetical protein
MFKKDVAAFKLRKGNSQLVLKLFSFYVEIKCMNFDRLVTASLPCMDLNHKAMVLMEEAITT